MAGPVPGAGGPAGREEALKASASKLRHWRATQTAWDDAGFLAQAANAFMKLRWRRLNRRAAAEAGGLRLKLGRPLDLVDLGCAHADFYEWSRPHLSSYTGIEPSKALLPKNISRGRAFRLLKGQAEKLPLKEACADFVLLKEVLDHCYDPLKVVKEARRVLRPGGELLITLTNDQAWYKQLLAGRAARIKSGQHDHLYFFKPSEVVHLASRAGFTRIVEEDSHYLRLPARAEEFLGRLPEPIGAGLISASDAVGELILPGAGGSFWVKAFK